MSKIIDSIWFTNLIDEKGIGIVKVDTGHGIRFYIGTADNLDQSLDELKIAQNGAPFYIGNLEPFFNTK